MRRSLPPNACSLRAGSGQISIQTGNDDNGKPTHNGPEHGNEVYDAFAVLQRDWCPDEQAPSQEEVHVPRSLIDGRDRYARLLGQSDKDRVNDRD